MTNKWSLEPKFVRQGDSICEDGIPYPLGSIVDRLNHYEDELKEIHKLNELSEENKTLQQTISQINTTIHKDREYCERLTKENKQLKEMNKNQQETITELEKELRKIYDTTTLHKAIDIIDKIYDDTTYKDPENPDTLLELKTIQTCRTRLEDFLEDCYDK